MAEPLLTAHGVSKRYGATLAVDDVDLSVAQSEVVGLLGKNGAGKSTLIKILAGVQRADHGTSTMGGVEIDLCTVSVRQARAAGIAVMFQELELFPCRSVSENVAIGQRLPRTRLGLVHDRRLDQEVQKVLDDLGADFTPSARVSLLSPAQQRAVMIARALHQGARLLVLDEPTTSLTDREILALHDVARTLAARGCGIVYVSHRLDEVMAVTDRTITMRDGRVVASAPTRESTVTTLISDISGRSEVTTSDERRRTASVTVDPTGASAAAQAPQGLRVEHLATRTGLSDVSLDAPPGAITGVAGLVGSGRTELLRAVFGVDRPTSGTIEVAGRRLKPGSTRDAISHGVALLPEDRRHEGLVTTMTIRENITLPSLDRFRIVGAPFPSRRRERARTREMCTNLKLTHRSSEQTVSTLSGGNQQKVVIAKWLLRGGEVLLFDEPTQGIDVDAKEEVYRLMERLAADGCAVVFVSSEFSELVATCSSVVVMREGRSVDVLRGDKVSEAAITSACYDRTHQRKASHVA